MTGLRLRKQLLAGSCFFRAGQDFAKGMENRKNFCENFPFHIEIFILLLYNKTGPAGERRSMSEGDRFP